MFYYFSMEAFVGEINFTQGEIQFFDIFKKIFSLIKFEEGRT